MNYDSTFWTLPLVEQEPWMQDRACRDHPDINWFPERGQKSDAAVTICLGCTVRHECLEYALDRNERFGIWGGYTAQGRVRIQARRRDIR